MKTGYFQLKFPIGKHRMGIFFNICSPVQDYPNEWRKKTIELGDKVLNDKFIYFHFQRFLIPPEDYWFYDPFHKLKFDLPPTHWSKINIDKIRIPDIKIIWEQSRFDWLVELSRAFRISGEEKYLNKINELLNSWSYRNPVNQGINWMCGQEAALRLMKLITSADILNNLENPEIALCEIVEDHLDRINYGINYALSQDNNHATSESAALFIGSSFLLSQKDKYQSNNKLKTYQKKGRRLLSNSLQKLVSKSGCFSQKSTNYHRVVMDTMSWVLYYNVVFNNKKLSDQEITILKV